MEILLPQNKHFNMFHAEYTDKFDDDANDKRVRARLMSVGMCVCVCRIVHGFASNRIHNLSVWDCLIQFLVFYVPCANI